MKRKFYRRLQRLLFKFGIFTQYYPSKENAYKGLINKPHIIQEHELRKISNTLKAVNDHSYYNSMLKFFIPSWNVEIKDPKIIEGGGGVGSLNSFRKVNIKAKPYFEKIYFSSGRELKAVKLYNNHVYPLMAQYEINAPELYKMYEGEVFTAVYFDFVTLKPFGKKEVEDGLIDIAKKLLRLSRDKSLKGIENIAAGIIRDYRLDPDIKKRIKHLGRKLQLYNISINKLDDKVANSRMVITHGDLLDYNVFKDSMLVDWDRFSIRPIGFDIAYLYYGMIIFNKIKFISTDWIKENFKDDIAVEDWKDFKRNFYYFLYLFLFYRIRAGNYKEFELDLIEKLKAIEE